MSKPSSEERNLPLNTHANSPLSLEARRRLVERCQHHPIAHVAKEKVLEEIFVRGEDVHTATASAVFEKPAEDLTPMDRSKAKMINYGIVYGLSDYGLADRLNIAGFSAAALHGDMHQGARNRTLDGMRRGQVKVLVATDVAARGIDVPTITHVFNYDLPKFPEDYVHRIGRTGRAGRNGLAISLVNHAEGMNVKRIERFTKQLIPVNVIEGFEPKKTASAPRSSARPGGWKPGDNRGGAKPAQRTFSKPGAPRKDGAPSTGGGYKGSNPRSTDGARRSYGDR